VLHNRKNVFLRRKPFEASIGGAAVDYNDLPFWVGHLLPDTRDCMGQQCHSIVTTKDKGDPGPRCKAQLARLLARQVPRLTQACECVARPASEALDPVHVCSVASLIRGARV
jgi:hypothetical protein